MAVDGSLIRAQDQPQVYLIEAQVRRWIPDPATLLSRWTWADVQVVPDDEVNAIPLGPPYPSVLTTDQWPDGALVEGEGDPHVYVIQGGQRHWIPDPETFIADGYDWAKVDVIPNSHLSAIPLGPPLPSTRRVIVDTGDYYLGSNHFMHTRAGLTIANGLFSAVTRIWTLTWFGGFHGGVSAVLYDSDELPVAAGVVPQVRLGVDGTAIGTSDRTVAWPGPPPLYINPNDALRVQSFDLYQIWAPDSFDKILSEWQHAGQTVTDLAKALAGVATVFHGQPAPAK